MIEGQRGKVVIKTPIHLDKFGCYTHNIILNMQNLCKTRYLYLFDMISTGYNPAAI